MLTLHSGVLSYYCNSLALNPNPEVSQNFAVVKINEVSQYMYLMEVKVSIEDAVLKILSTNW